MGLYCFQQHGVNIFDNLISLTHVRSQRDYRTLSLSTKNQPHFYGQSSYVNYVLRFLCGNFTVLTLDAINHEIIYIAGYLPIVLNDLGKRMCKYFFYFRFPVYQKRNCKYFNYFLI